MDTPVSRNFDEDASDLRSITVRIASVTGTTRVVAPRSNMASLVQVISGNFTTSVEESRKQMWKRNFCGSFASPRMFPKRKNEEVVPPQVLPLSEIFDRNGLVENRKQSLLETLKDLIV